MPRSVDPVHTRRWAELAVLGKTVAEIRRDHKNQTGKVVDPRTIERALVRTQAEIAERTATSAELQRGIRAHGEQILAGIGPIDKAVRSVASSPLNPLPIYALSSNQITVGASIADRDGDSWKIQIAGEDSIELRLLKEHLPNDKVWKMLENFSDSVANWITARVNFASSIKQELKNIAKTLGNSTESDEEPFELAGLTQIDAAAATARIEGLAGIDELLDSLVVDSQSDGARIDLTKLSSLWVPDIDKFRATVSHGVGAVMKSQVGRDILTNKTAFDRTASNLRDELAMLRMVTYLPGTCTSCKRFRLG